MNSQQQTLDGYNRTELHKIVDIYNLGYDLKKLQKNKADLLKELKKVPKKKFVDLPSKAVLKKHKLPKKVPPVKEGQGNIKDFFNSKDDKGKAKAKPKAKTKTVKVKKDMKQGVLGPQSDWVKELNRNSGLPIKKK